MSGLRGSPGFIWDIKRQLGQGATSMVCAGRNKHTGEQVAVKVFNQAGTTRPSNVKNREFDVLRKLNHDNIVRMIACEAEQSSSNLVIVMELCTGGSLYTILEDPKNAFGVEEEEFLLILEHVASGMKHLRENGIVHRDIKPGNIMRFIAEDGRSIYKLTDFGAARELDEEGQFMSLYGTEEYLHPDMYERAVLRGSQYKVFGATVDLWSLGVTFYHVLTGQLPFRPFGGRRNKETMHKITTQKESGVISGVQETEGGSIDWSRQLPQSCRISQGLQLLVTPFLAGLLEADQRKTWQFDKFFIEARKITSKKLIPMFSPATWQLLYIYADPTDTLIRLQELVAYQTEFPATSQLLLYQNNLLSELVDLDEPVTNYPKCISRQKPIFVFPSADIEFQFPIPSLTSFPRFTTTMNLDNDYPLAKMCVGNLHAIHREISDCVLRQQLSHDSVVCYRNQLYHFLEHLRDYRFHLSSLCTETSKRKADLVVDVKDKIRLLEILSKEYSEEISPLLQELITKWSKNRQKFEELEKTMKGGLSKIENYIDTFTKELVQKTLLKSWDFKQGCSPGQRCAPKLEMAIKTASTIMERFRADKKRGTLPYNDEQIHKFEKNNLYSLTVKAQSTIREHCVQNAQRLSALLYTWLRQGNALRRESLEVEKKMTDLIEDQQLLTTTLDQNGQKMVSNLVSRTIDKYHNDGFKRKHKELPFMALTPSINGITSINGRLVSSLLYLKDQDFVLKNWLLERRDELKISDLESKSKVPIPEDIGLERIKKWTQLATKCDLEMPILKGMTHQTDSKHFEEGEIGGIYGQQFHPHLYEQLYPNSSNNIIEQEKTNSKASSSCHIECSPLHHAVKENDLETVCNITLSNSKKSSQTNKNGLSPLHLSCSIGNLEVTKLLLEWDKTVVEVKDRFDLSPLHWAVWAGHSQVVKILLASERSLMHDRPQGMTSLHLAAAKGHMEILKMLAEMSHKIDALNADLRTPLHLAVMQGLPQMVQYLLQLGADPSSTDKAKFSALHYAARLGSEEIVGILLLSGKINRVFERSAGGEFIIFLAIKSGSAKVVKMLLTCGFQVDLTELDNEKRGVLHLACIHGNQDMVECILPLIGNTVNRGDKYGWTALHYAAKFQTKSTLRLLVKSGANLDVQNCDKQTPLHIAALSASPNARVLIELDTKTLEALDE